MGFADHYFSKQKGFVPHTADPPSARLRFIVVIPACREPDLVTSLESLYHCTRPAGHVEVIVVLNLPEDAGREIVHDSQAMAAETLTWMALHSSPGFRFLLVEELKMPVRDAGVGLARKTGMDQALYRFNMIDNPAGFILSFDADSRCEPGYFTAIERCLADHPRTNGINLYFEHPVSGNEFPGHVYRGIISYEMHLRYLNLMIRSTGFPFAFHTIGSSFGVRADAYAGQGGMNRRKAGEDFYFLHKIIPLGEFREINNTCVIPSPRESDRVPFGTGAAIVRFVKSGGQEMLTYAPECFHDLRNFFAGVASLPDMHGEALDEFLNRFPDPLKTYLTGMNARKAILEIQANSASGPAFINRFYRWFDAFRIIKFLNYACTWYPRIPVELAVRKYLEFSGTPLPAEPITGTDLLNMLRETERKR
jgi:hypothetical protein